MTRRDQALGQLRRQTFDVLIVGGGIVGAGIARDAAMRGLRVALVEKGDFASGTSSKTSKLIHGGLRYLEQGHFHLVFESLRERHILHSIAPQWVWPLPFVIPVYATDARAAWKIGLGLTLYDALAGSRRFSRHRLLSKRAALQQEIQLKGEDLRAAAWYVDCQMDDARLCLSNILQAASFGAACGNYVRVLAFNQLKGRLCGAVVEDVLTGAQWSLQARSIVNATGPWSDQIRRMSDRAASVRMAPTKGIHVIVKRLTAQALFFQAQHDRRMIFLLPWGDYSLIGTTESGAHNLEALHATAQEVDYLLGEVNRILPEAHVQAQDVVATYAGARPLLAFSSSATQASREHRLEIDQHGLLSVMGGKYTTFRVMAKQAVDTLTKQLHARTERCLTDQVMLMEPTYPVVFHRWQDIAHRIDSTVLQGLLTKYGVGAFRILELLDLEPGLSQWVCPHHTIMQAELIHAMREEFACTITDILVRRTAIAFSSCQGLDMLSTMLDLLHRYCRISRETLETQLAAYHQFLAQGLAFRPVLVSAHER